MSGLTFSPTEAAAVTGLPIKAVNKAIERRLVPTLLKKYGKISKRYLSHASLMCLQLDARGTRYLPLPMRRHIFRQLVRSPRQAVIRQSEAVLIDVKAARQSLASALFDLRKAKQVIVRDPEILSGIPVLKGTRVPAYLIADMLEDGAVVREILEGYPSLTEESIRLAQLYARAFPKRGRPQRQARRENTVRSRRQLRVLV